MWLRAWVIALGLGLTAGLSAGVDAAETTQYRSEHVVIVAVGGLTTETFDSARETARLREAVAGAGARAQAAGAPERVEQLAALLPAGEPVGQPLMVASRTWPAGPPSSGSGFKTAESNLAAFHSFSQALFARRPKAALLAVAARGRREAADVDLLISYLWLRLQSEAPFKGKTTLAIVARPSPPEPAADTPGLFLLLGPDARSGARAAQPLAWADLRRLPAALLTGTAVDSEVAAALVKPPKVVALAPETKPEPAAKPAKKKRPRVRRSIDLELSGYVASEAVYGSGRLALKRASDRATVSLRGTVSKSITRIEGVSLSERPNTVRRLADARAEWRDPPSENYRYLGLSVSERKRENKGVVVEREAYHFVVAGFGRPVSSGWKADLGVGWFETQNEREQVGWGPAVGWQLNKRLSERLSLRGDAVFIQPMSSPRRTRFQSDLTVSRPLTERLSLRLGLILDNFTRPLRVSEDWSYQARVSLGYRYSN